MLANPLDRCLPSSPMLPNFVRDDDGGIAFYLQHDSTGEELEANWLPAPAVPSNAVMRLYWPKQEALDGARDPPPLDRADHSARPCSFLAPESVHNRELNVVFSYLASSD